MRRFLQRKVNLCENEEDVLWENTRKFSYESLQTATDHFSARLLIGEGGSARVYRGILPNGLQVAVKKYWRDKVLISSEFNFKEMVSVMSQIQHRNVHRTLGCCTDDDNLIVVSAYAEKGSLNHMLRPESSFPFSFLNWNTRAAICVGIARGLSYLHEDANPRVIHRDIKSSNILLDNNFTPKITDFELIKFFCDSNELPLEGNVVGTFGYLDPEYLHTSQYTDKVDVYSFGVLMLEIISGRAVYFKCSKEEEKKQHIVRWASRLVKKDRILEIVDPALTDLPTDDAQRFVDVALLCVQLDSKLRPSMQEVVHMLYGVCNSSRLSITRPDLSLIDDQTNANVSQDSSTQGSLATTGVKDEEQGESSILPEEGPKSAVATEVEGGGIDVRAHVGDLIRALNNILRIQGVEVSIVREHAEIEAKDTPKGQGEKSILQDRSVESAAASSETTFHDCYSNSAIVTEFDLKAHM